MKKPKPLFLGVLLRVHDRPLTTQIVLSELRAYKYLDPARLDVGVCVWADRPTPEVKRVLDSYTDLIDAVEYSRFPLLDHRGEHFLEAQNKHLELAERTWSHIDWIYVSDDDHWFEPLRAYANLIPALERPEVGGYIVECLFFQAPDLEGVEGEETHYFNALRKHNSIILYRHVPGERFSGGRMLKCPDATLDDIVIQDRERRLDIPALEYGGFRYLDRQRVHRRYIEAGKVNDRFVDALLSSDLRKFPDRYAPSYGKWLDRMHEHLHAGSPQPALP